MAPFGDDLAARFRRVFVLIPVAFILVAVWVIGSSNPVTPAGYVGYLTQGAVLGKARFYGLQKGPTSPGRAWLVSVTNVSVQGQPADRLPSTHRLEGARGPGAGVRRAL